MSEATGPAEPVSSARPRFRIWRGAGIILGGFIVSLYLIAGFFTVKVNERAIVERFGRPIRPDQPLRPGLHYAWAWPVSKVRKVNTGRICSIELGYRGTPPKGIILWAHIPYEDEMLLLTRQNTFISLFLQVHYQVRAQGDGPSRFLYRCDSPEKLLEAVSAASLRELVSRSDFAAVMTTGRDEFEVELRNAIQGQVGEYGLELVDVTVRDVHPPAAVTSAFEDVFSAEEDQEAFVSEAQGYWNDTIPRAEGQMAMMTAEAYAYGAEKASRAEGRAESFTLRLNAYQSAPKVTRTRLYFDGLTESLSGARKYIVPAAFRTRLPLDVWMLQDGKMVSPAPEQISEP